MTYAELLAQEKYFVQFKKTFILQYDPNGITHTFNKDDEQDKMLLAAIEKQVPKKPLTDPKWIFSLQCPFCRAAIADTEHRWEKRREHLKATMFYCPYCGQAIDWE